MAGGFIRVLLFFGPAGALVGVLVVHRGSGFVLVGAIVPQRPKPIDYRVREELFDCFLAQGARFDGPVPLGVLPSGSNERECTLGHFLDVIF